MKMSRTSKKNNVMKSVGECLESGQYRYVGHANLRLQERVVTRLEVKQVLKMGFHERRKDEFKEEHGSWNYSIRGRTVDKRSLRVVVTFDESNMLIVTVIDLDK